MTRRPHRPTPSSSSQRENVRLSKAQSAKRTRPKAIDFLSESEGQAEPVRSTHVMMVPLQKAHGESDSQDISDTDMESPSSGDESEEDTDAPRVAQWVDDEPQPSQRQRSDDGFPSPNSTNRDHDHGTTDKTTPLQSLRSLEDDLSTLPLGTLRHAQRTLAQAQALSDSESDFDDASQSDDDAFPRPAKDKRGEPSRAKNDIAKRANKHAPMEVTSKRPVTRRRVVVDDRLPKPRDPRFMNATGSYDASKFKQRYEFLSDLRKEELSTLRDHVKRARKLVGNTPSHLRTEREEEVTRLERAMKRAEGTVNADNRERVELAALQVVKQTEKEKRKRGKAEWWMKRSEKKELLAKARLDAIAEVGGKRAVKKAVEKKQKKISQKEKKTRPFPQSDAMDGRKRRPVGSVSSGAMKRRKVG